MTTFTEAYKEALVSADHDVVILDTLEVIHSSFPGSTPIRIVNDFQDVVATLEATAPVNPSTAVTFSSGFFSIVRPKRTSSGYTPARLAISNVDQVMKTIELARGSREQITVIFRSYLSTDLTAPQNNPPLQLPLKNTQATVDQVTGTLAAPTIIGRAHPSDLITPQRFPGLVR